MFLESLTVSEGNPFIEAVRTSDWKYVRYMPKFGCPYTEDDLDFSQQQPIFEQLFDLRDDPRAGFVNLVDLGSGETVGVAAALNSQVAHGEDVITRIIHASEPGGLGQPPPPTSSLLWDCQATAPPQRLGEEWRRWELGGSPAILYFEV